MKYMIMECHPGYAVALDDQGSFLKVVNRNYEVGQTVNEVIPIEIQFVPRKRPAKWLYSLAAMAACLILLVTAVFPNFHRPYASVYVKINPEVRIDVDKNDKVVGLEGINADGIALIEGYDFHHKDLELVADELVDMAIEGGFLQADGTINLTLDSADEAWVTGHGETLSNHIHSHMQTRFTVTIQVSLNHKDHHVDLPSQATPTVPPTTAADLPSPTEVIYDDDDDDDDDHDWDDDHDDDHDWDEDDHDYDDHDDEDDHADHDDRDDHDDDDDDDDGDHDDHEDDHDDDHDDDRDDDDDD